MTDKEECRFCEGTEENAPIAVDRPIFKKIDPVLLKDVLLYEFAWRTLHEEEPIPKELLDANGCRDKDIEQELLRQRAGTITLPTTRYARRLVELNLVSYWTPEQLALMALADLGSTLDTKKENRLDESLIVLEHALRRTEGQDALMHERGRILNNLANLYFRKKDDDKHQLYKSMAHECEKFGMSEEMQAMMDMSNKNLESLFQDNDLFEKDPAKRLESLDKQFNQNGVMDKLLKQMETTLPGMGEMFASLQNNMNEMMKGTRLILEAQVLRKNGDLQAAEEKFKEALEQTSEDRFTGSTSKVNILCSIAEIKQAQGNHAEADTLLKDALVSATEYAEASPAMGRYSLLSVFLAQGALFKESGRFDEAEQCYQKSLKLHAENAAESIEKYGSEPAEFAGQEGEIKEKYAQLLRAKKQDEAAAKMEAEVVTLKEQAEKRQAEVLERRKKFKT